ncbi:MAG: hypothetical protein HYY95_09780 [Candidatus Rokubacteria bacterium]|nr:hypothetical protein [Candidatus Rokubacteria bacterium]
MLILGAGGHARAVADLAAACGWTVIGFTDPAAPPAGAAGGRPAVIGDDVAADALARAGGMGARPSRRMSSARRKSHSVSILTEASNPITTPRLSSPRMCPRPMRVA